MSHITRYQATPTAGDYPRGVDISPLYSVWAKAVGDTVDWDPSRHESAVYRWHPDYPDPETLPRKHADTAVHGVNVDSDTRLRIHIQLQGNKTAERIVVKPSRITEVQETLTTGRDWIEFEVEPADLTRHSLVEIDPPENDADPLQDGLMIFVNPPSVIPKGNILCLPPGIIDESSPWMDEYNRILIPPDSPFDGIYLPGDCIVNGRIEVQKPDFSVTGRGMLVGSRWEFVKTWPNWRTEGYPPALSPDRRIIKGLLSYEHPRRGEIPNHTYFEGITVVHPYHFCFTNGALNENLKALGWRYSSDGVHGAVKRGCFTRVNDDAMYINQGSIEDCSIWGMVNGAAFQLGWGLFQNNDTEVHVRRCDILRGEWDTVDDNGLGLLGAPEGVLEAQGPQVGGNKGVFAGTFRGGTGGTVSNKHFHDIRIECRANRIFYFGSRTDKVFYGNLSFEGLILHSPPLYKDFSNYLACAPDAGTILFRDCSIAGRRIASLEDLRPIEGTYLENIKFEESNSDNSCPDNKREEA